MIFYMPILVVVTCLFVIGELLMSPFVYVKMVFHKLTMTWVYSKSFRVSRADKFMNFIFYLFLGPLFVLGGSVVDTWFFIRHLVIQNVQKIKHKTRFNQVNKEALHVIETLFKEKQEKVLNFKEVSARVREDMGIMTLIRHSMFPKLQPPKSKKSAMDKEEIVNRLHQDHDSLQINEVMQEQRKQMILKIKEFASFKEIMDRNS